MISPLGGQLDHGHDMKTQGGRGVGISPGGGGTRICGFTPHRGVYSETAGDHSGTGGMTPICEIFTKAEQRPGTSWMMRWWNQDVVQDSEE